MFDLTKEIPLEKEWLKKYAQARAILYGIFFAGLIVFAYVILFPSLSFDYFFKLSDDALKNTIISPRNLNQQLIQNGQVPSDKKLILDTSLVGNFSKTHIVFDLEKNSAPISQATTTIRKSYREFFYPTGDPMGFKDGSLLSTDTDHYLVSSGTLRKFPSPEITKTMGFPPTGFLHVLSDELSYNPTGPDIVNGVYPSGTLFKIEDDYYQLRDDQLNKFISARAFLSQYSPGQAVTKEKDFLKSYDAAQTFLGFPDGTLASSSTSIFILSKGKSYPIDTPATFETMGFVWSDVLALTSDELSMYTKQKLAYQDHPHPDGTIFADKQSGTYYIIDNQKKHPLFGPNLIKTYLKKNPVLIDAKSLDIKETCVLSKKILSVRSYGCTAPLEKLTNLPGNNYQFEITFPSDAHLKETHIRFATYANWSNLKKSLSNIKSLLMVNYTNSN